MKAVTLTLVVALCFSLCAAAADAIVYDTTAKTSSGITIEIYAPDATSVLKPGDSLNIQWRLDGPFDPTFITANMTFEINDATNNNNVILAPNGTLTFTAQPLTSDSSAKTTVPVIPFGKSYTVRAIAKDPSTGKTLSWFSPKFQINGAAAAQSPPAAGSTGGAAATTNSKAPGSVTSAASYSSRIQGVSSCQFWFAVAAAVILAF
ncbi:hypothetical protein BDR26DRAFT_858720 [Obelidium mucronatum]|nr:hypothetical protein BDR26DRAFT_858720 [Obelidium mucronatum]